MLTTKKIEALQPAEKPYKASDAEGLHVFVSPAGSKTFRLKYRVRLAGKTVEKLLTIGQFPAVSLNDARLAVKRAKLDLDAGRDPGAANARKPADEAAANTLRAVTEKWLALHGQHVRAITAESVAASFAKHVLPALGDLDIAKITRAQVSDVLEAILLAGHPHAAKRMRARINEIFEYACDKGLCEVNPTPRAKSLHLDKVRVKNMPAQTTIPEVRACLDKIAGMTERDPILRAAIRFVALTSLRTSSVRFLTWDEIQEQDGRPVVRLSAERMKIQDNGAFTCPLSPAAVAILEELRPITGHGRYVFPAARSAKRGGDQVMHDSAMGQLLRIAGFGQRQTIHGLRASFATIMADRHPGDRLPIEAQLAHAIKGVEGDYNRGNYFRRRCELVDEWAALLTAQEAPAEAKGLRLVSGGLEAA